jgi:hypothetical protein
MATTPATVTVDKFHVILLVLALALAGFGAYSWVNYHDQKVIAAQKDSDTQAQVKQIEATQQAAAAKESEDLAAIQTQYNNSIKTLQGQIQYLQSSLNVTGLKQPITISVPTATPANPTPPAIINVPQQDLPQFDAMVKDYQDLKVKEPVCEASLADEQQSNKLLQADIKQLKKPKGFWKAFGHDAKITGIALGVGIGIGLAVSSHKL